jgi:hypothetical protein
MLNPRQILAFAPCQDIRFGPAAGGKEIDEVLAPSIVYRPITLVASPSRTTTAECAFIECGFEFSGRNT